MNEVDDDGFITCQMGTVGVVNVGGLECVPKAEYDRVAQELDRERNMQLSLETEIVEQHAELARCRGLLGEALLAIPTKSNDEMRVEYLKCLITRIDAALAGEKP